MKLTTNQLTIVRRIGQVVDELRLRNLAAGRSLEAMHERRRGLQREIGRIDGRIRDEQMEFGATVSAEKAVVLKGLREEQAALRDQLVAIEKEIDTAAAKRDRLVEYLAPWDATLDAVVAYARTSRAALGIAGEGEEIPGSVRADLELGERPQ